MEEGAGVGQFWTPILAKGGSLLHADSHLRLFVICEGYQTLRMSLDVSDLNNGISETAFRIPPLRLKKLGNHRQAQDNKPQEPTR